MLGRKEAPKEELKVYLWRVTKKAFYTCREEAEGLTGEIRRDLLKK